jgi:hypothetical protein
MGLKKSKGRIAGNIFDKFDFYAVPITAYNFEGETQVGTSIGCFFSFIFATFVSVYIITQGTIFIRQTQPLITTTELENQRAEEDKQDLSQYNFMIAFAARRANDSKPLIDPNFVEYVPYIDVTTDDNQVHHPLTYHKCTKRDYGRFYEANES